MGWCDYCQGLGTIECECGGDFCVCGLQEIDCPKCHGHCDEDEYNDEEMDGE